MPFIAARAYNYWPAADILNEKAFNWMGLISRKPITEDYVPLLPWLGVMWWGTAAGQWMLRSPPAWLGRRRAGAAGRGLAAWGRWSLSWYMLHQPLLIGALMLIGWLRR